MRDKIGMKFSESWYAATLHGEHRLEKLHSLGSFPDNKLRRDNSTTIDSLNTTLSTAREIG